VDELDLSAIRRKLAQLSPRTSEEAPRAAVAAVLRERAKRAEILFIKRAEHDGDPWSGHMAFPGGRLDPNDTGLEHTVMRETEEEIGLDLARYGELIARLDDVPTHTTGLVVRPFVWVIDDPPVLVPNHEVDEVHWVDLHSLMRGACDATFHLEWKGETHLMPAYRVGERTVWGLTYRMLQILFESLR
jgi:8-oxo-dGTP pyrophosphatase MutT (NUDIX family)